MIYLPHQINGGTTVANTVLNFINNTKRITIDSVKGIRVSDNVTFTDVLDLCLNAIVSNAFKVVELTVMEHDQELDKSTAVESVESRIAKLNAIRKAVTEHLYDKMNESFTYTLEVFAPDIARHPGLSDLAIMKAEDEIIAAYLDSLPEEEREAAAKAVVELAGESKRKLMQRIAEINEARAQQEAAFVPLTPDQDKAIHTLADEEATEEEQEAAKAYLAENPLPCMVPAVEPDAEVPTFEVTPTKEELDDCGAICSQCENEACKNPTVEKGDAT